VRTVTVAPRNCYATQLLRHATVAPWQLLRVASVACGNCFVAHATRELSCCAGININFVFDMFCVCFWKININFVFHNFAVLSWCTEVNINFVFDKTDQRVRGGGLMLQSTVAAGRLALQASRTGGGGTPGGREVIL